MASAARLPLKSIGFAVVLIAGAGASRTNLRQLLLETFTGPGKYKRIAAFVLVLLNLKSLPFAWHFRVLNGIYRHCVFSLPNIPADKGPSSLFLPVITTSRPSLWECDYNFHKSNSTYFSDADVTRAHAVCVLLQPAIHKLNNNDRYRLVVDASGKPLKQRWALALGGVMCTFKREIGMFEGYEMWSRLLCWDRKWIYVVSHFVKKGVVRPSEYILTDGSWFGGKGYRKVGGKGAAVEVEEKHIFATSVARYVGKKGRLTIHPEVMLDAAGLLPPKPGGWAKMDGSSGENTPELAEIETNGHAKGPEEDVWDWRRTEAENKKGLEYAYHFAALEGLQHEFTGSRQAALGRYRDFLW